MSSMMASIFYNYGNFSTGPLEITITGLTAGARYSVNEFTYDDNDANRVNETFAINGVTTNVFSMAPFVSYLVSNVATANMSGDIILDVTQPAHGTAILSGFLIAQTPEPSGLVLLGLGVAALLWKVRRRCA